MQRQELPGESMTAVSVLQRVKLEATNSTACGDLLLIPLPFLWLGRLLKMSCNVHTFS